MTLPQNIENGDASSAAEDTPGQRPNVVGLAYVVGSLMVWGLVGMATKRFLTDPPAPEAVFFDQLIRTAGASLEQRPLIGISLLPAVTCGFHRKSAT